MKQKILKKLFYVLMLFIMVIEFKFISIAGETNEHILMETQRETKVYEEMDENSKVVIILEKGTPIIAWAVENASGWYEITYQGKNGFVSYSNLNLYGDVEEINEEFSDIREEELGQFEVVQEAQLQKRSEFFWGGIMLALIIAILAVGVYTALKNVKKGD